VEFSERTPSPPEGHWTWERECEAAEGARIVGVSACRRRENPLWLTSEEWTEQILDGSVRPIIADLEHPVGPGRYVVVASIWASTDYYGEHDEGIDVVEVRRSPGNCKRYWRRRAHERKACDRLVVALMASMEFKGFREMGICGPFQLE
jgi:hypothetical protein